MVSAYDNEAYMQSLNASQGDIQRSVMNSIGEITKQKAAAQLAAGKIKDAAAATYDAGGQSSLAELAGGLTPDLGGVFANMKDAYAQAGTLMQKGFEEQAVRRYGQAKGLGTELSTANTQKINEYVSTRTREDAQRAAAEKEAALNRALQMEIARQQNATARAAISASERMYSSGGTGLPQQAVPVAAKNFYDFSRTLSPEARYLFGGALSMAKSNPSGAMGMFNTLDPATRQALQGFLGKAILDPKVASGFARNLAPAGPIQGDTWRNAGIGQGPVGPFPLSKGAGPGGLTGGGAH